MLLLCHREKPLEGKQKKKRKKAANERGWLKQYTEAHRAETEIRSDGDSLGDAGTL